MYANPFLICHMHFPLPTGCLPLVLGIHHWLGRVMFLVPRCFMCGARWTIFARGGQTLTTRTGKAVCASADTSTFHWLREGRTTRQP